jgi:hypothetical protein
MKAMESNEATELLESFSSEHVQIGRAQVKLERLPHPADVTAAGVVAHAKAMGLLWRDAFALLEGESGFRNVFGHDHGGLFPGQRVTRKLVREMIAQVREGHISNGVGVTQLTSLGFILAAERAGGAHHAAVQSLIGFQLLRRLQQQFGRRDGFAAYNGGAGGRKDAGPQAYAEAMMRRADHWVRVFHGKA